MSSIALGLVLVEALLRMGGYRPAFPPMRRGHRNEPTLNIPDPVIGWRPKPGYHWFPGYTPGAAPITMTFWPNGSRATSARPIPRERRVVFIGDSFTEGWAISDPETYVWKLQARYPTVEFLNYGTAGYNGLQALLRIEEDLDARPTPPPLLVVYGFNEDQERRNVAENSWLRMFAMDTTRGMTRVPYCLLDGAGQLRRYSPEGVPTWPLRERFAFVPVLEGAYFDYVTRHRHEQARRVTELLIEEMQRVVLARGSHFLVAILAGRPDVRRHYATYLPSRGIETVDCSYGGGLRVPGEGHPNGEGHTRWANCLARNLDPKLAPAATAGSP